MIGALARSFLTRRLCSPMRLLFLLLLAGQDLVQVLLSGRAGPAEGILACLATLLFGAGLVGQERKDGSLALLLTRPFPRSSLVIAAWLAAAVGGVGVWLVLTSLHLALAVLPQVDVQGSGQAWVTHAATALGGSLGLAAVVVFFGVAFRGLSGVAAHAGLIYLATTLSGLANDSGRESLKWLASEGVGLLLPVPKFAELLSPGGWSWFGLVTPASNATLALLAACWLLGRAQLSYSQGA